MGVEDPEWFKNTLAEFPLLSKEDEDEELFPDEEEVEPLDPKQMLVGTTFPDKQAFVRHLKGYCVLNECTFKAEKSDNKRLRAWCTNRFNEKGEEVCNWVVYASKLKEESTFQVKTVDLTHTCKGTVQDKRNRCADPQFVCESILARLKNTSMDVIPRPKQIQDDFETDFLIEIPYHTAWKARNLVLESQHGSYEDSFKDVPQFCKMVMKLNDGSVAKFTYCKLDNAFETLTISFEGSIRAFYEGCRPCIGLDATHLNGKCGGVLMAATALDGQNGLVSLAIMVCRLETIENWTIFLEDMKDKFEGHPQPLTFISDRQKGLLEAVPAVFPGRPHRYCWR